MKAILALADGRTFEGQSFGATGEAEGEVVFNTSMTGYQEVITDPSYCGQIVAMTYPLIGNYGINPEDFESSRPHLSGFIVKEQSGIASNWRSRLTLDQFLRDYGIVGIEGIDTRALTRHIRQAGAQQAVVSTQTADLSKLVERARLSPGLIGRDLVKEVTCKAPYDWDEGEWTPGHGYSRGSGESGEGKSERLRKVYTVVAYDFGIKRNILRILTELGCKVRIEPASTPAEDVLAMKPDGVFLSNGPGDPEGVPYVVENVKRLVGKVPIFGICLGHQILNLALGASTYKLRFGHHGGNQPVMDLRSRKLEITAQNHGFAVDGDSVKGNLELTAINLNDQTIEGIRHKTLPILSVQYHPEASPGPHDSKGLFHEFIKLMQKNKC
ncbi:MAG: glutamine-hydrolyzing carbamoyl-phosphate synthase small subunit [Nitrospinales bacterium]